MGSSRFPCVTSVVEIFSSDRVAFRILSNINDTAQHVDCFHKKVPPQTSDRVPNADPTGGAQIEEGRGEGDGLKVHGIRSCRLMCKEVVEALSNYEKSNFW